MKKTLTTKLQFATFVPGDLPISVLGLDKRSINALSRNGILTCGQIEDIWDDLQEIRGLGVGSVKEIRAAYFAYNLKSIWDDEAKLHRFARALDWWKEKKGATV